MILKPSNQRGYTLLELMITIAIAVIIASAVTAGWQGIIDNTTGQRVRSHLVQSFADARSEAVMKNQVTTLCPLDSDNKCSSDWDQPISIFTDPLNERALTATTELLYTHHSISTGKLVASNSGPAERRYFQYNPDGSAKGTIGNIIWCPESRDVTRAIQLIINFGGRITWARDRDGDGVREDAHGNALACH